MRARRSLLAVAPASPQHVSAPGVVGAESGTSEREDEAKSHHVNSSSSGGSGGGVVALIRHSAKTARRSLQNLLRRSFGNTSSSGSGGSNISCSIVSHEKDVELPAAASAYDHQTALPYTCRLTQYCSQLV